MTRIGQHVGKIARSSLAPLPSPPLPLMNPFVASAVVVGVILLLSVLSILAGRGGGAGWRDRSVALKSLIKEAARNVATADQDTNPSMAFLHTTLAKGYLNGARAIASDETTKKICGVHAAELLAMIDEKQENCLKNMNHTCPGMAIDSEALRSTGWLL